MEPTRDEVVELVADALWRLGNERIGHREWSLVGDMYVSEARKVVDELRSAGVLVGPVVAVEPSPVILEPDPMMMDRLTAED